jgi:hypothetical protein
MRQAGRPDEALVSQHLSFRAIAAQPAEGIASARLMECAGLV